MKFDLKAMKNITVLYVEDEEIIRDQTVTIFNNLFKKTFVADNGEDALELFKNNSDIIDILVTDINMPYLSGLELAERVHQIRPKLPIVLTTAFTDEEYLLKSLELDINKYMTKPLKIKELAVTIGESVQKYRDKQDKEIARKRFVDQTAKLYKEKNSMETDIAHMQNRMEFYEDLIETHVPNFVMDSQGIIKSASQKFCEIFRYEKSELIGKSINSISDEASIFIKNILTVAKHNKPVTFQKEFKTKDDRSLTLETTIFPQKDAEGLVSNYHCYQNIIV